MISIGKIIEADYQTSGLTASKYAELIGTTRSNLYSIFRRQSIDSEQLYQISVKRKRDFFRLFSEELAKSNPEIFETPEPIETEQTKKRKRKILLEIELDDEEYRKLLKKNIK